MEQQRYHIIVASIIFAVLAWISINMSGEYTIVKQMPVVLENMREGRALKYPVPRTVNVWFRGSGWQLAAIHLSPAVKYFIDLSSVGMDNFVITRRDLFEHVKLPIALQPIDVKPDTLILALDDYKEKHVPIATRIVLEFHEGYGQVGLMNITPDSVMIGGSPTLMAKITGWPTIYRKYNDLRASVNEEILLEEPVSYSTTVFSRAIRLQVNVQPFAEKVFTGIPIIATGTPVNREIIFIPPQMNLIVRGGIDQLAKLTDADFQATIEYQKLVDDSSEYIIPALSVPAEVKIVSRKPERLQFIIRKRL
ncbi:MAG: hypothetical protein HY033_05260 [Ignavibacteriae bacterium]|nr:hypothetical protein [Ignavibacteria bacterium]MBI3364297.1 hypothetical protein [Ignavibacteriota bacterium]